MRIGISGTGSTGKSTLTTALSAALHVPAIGEGVHEWLAAYAITGPWSLALDEQLQLQRHAISYKIERESALQAFVSDRTTVDAVTLVTLRLERFAEPPRAALIDDALRHARSTYDVAVLLGHRISSAPDEVALLDPTLRLRELELTRSLYASIAVPLIEVPSLPAAEIAPFVLAALQERPVR
jgi:nicotinamide riboside kinase